MSTNTSRLCRHADRLVERHGDRVWRIGLDGGFGCPHRVAGRGGGGCVFCAPDGARSVYTDGRVELDSQIRAGLDFLRRRYAAKLFMPYFQAYSSTNAEPSILRRRYDQALNLVETLAPGSLRGMVISTRPDCLDREKVALIAEYARSGLEVWVELGLQSSHESTLKRIRRGHGLGEFLAARRLLAKRGLKTAAHLILGLPGETSAMMLESVELLAALKIDGLKFHDLYIAKGSALESEYRAGELCLLHPSRMPTLLADCLERLPPDCEIMRLCSDSQTLERRAPKKAQDKTLLYQAVEAELARRRSRQGSLFVPRANWRASGPSSTS